MRRKSGACILRGKSGLNPISKDCLQRTVLDGMQSELTESSGQCRTIIEAVSPEIDGGEFPIKRVKGEEVVVEADIFADGHDVISPC